MGRSQTFLIYAGANWAVAATAFGSVWAGMPSSVAVTLALVGMEGVTYLATPAALRNQHQRIAMTAIAAMVCMVMSFSVAMMLIGVATGIQAVEAAQAGDHAALLRLAELNEDNGRGMMVRAFWAGSLLYLLGFRVMFSRVAPRPAEEDSAPAWTKIM